MDGSFALEMSDTVRNLIAFSTSLIVHTYETVNPIHDTKD
jgi:hypothetical protein